MPGTARFASLSLGAIREPRAKFIAPAANGFVTHHDAALEEQLFNVAQAQLKPEIPANGTTDHHRREAMAVIERFRLFHLPILRDHLGNVTKPPADLQGESFISLCHGDGTRAQIDEVFLRAGVERTLAIEAQYSAICCEMVRCGMGVTLTHPIVARDFAGPDIAVRRFSPAVPFSTYLLFPPHQPRERLASAFTEVLRSLHNELIAEINTSAATPRRMQSVTPHK
jgi:hypothetical protein